jgi:hypothetical protein
MLGAAEEAPCPPQGGAVGVAIDNGAEAEGVAEHIPRPLPGDPCAAPGDADLDRPQFRVPVVENRRRLYTPVPPTPADGLVLAEIEARGADEVGRLVAVGQTTFPPIW